MEPVKLSNDELNCAKLICTGLGWASSCSSSNIFWQAARLRCPAECVIKMQNLKKFHQ